MNVLTNTIAAAGMCLSLTACGPHEAAATVDSIQKATVAACGFLPTAQTILSIFSSNQSVATASAIAEGICKAVTKSGGGNWVYNGVPVEGRFVRR